LRHLCYADGATSSIIARDFPAPRGRRGEVSPGAPADKQERRDLPTPAEWNGNNGARPGGTGLPPAWAVVAEAAMVKTVATTSLRIIFGSPCFYCRARRMQQAFP
jgi:hypothetical protein